MKSKDLKIGELYLCLATGPRWAGKEDKWKYTNICDILMFVESKNLDNPITVGVFSPKNIYLVYVFLDKDGDKIWLTDREAENLERINETQLYKTLVFR